MKCFYHNDLDGRCAGAIVARATGCVDANSFREVDYIKPLDLSGITAGETVYFVDYSFTNEVTRSQVKLLSQNCNVIWIDHHESSLKLEKSDPIFAKIGGLRNSGYSGAALTYMWFYHCEYVHLPICVIYVDDYDRFVFGCKDTMSFKLGMESRDYGPLAEVWTSLLNPYAESPMREIISDGAVIQRYVDADNKLYRDAHMYGSALDDGTPILVVNRKSNSKIFGDLYAKYPIVCTWAFNGSKYVYSLYSGDTNVDCATIAEKYGGGGHRGAAGFTSDKLLFTEKRGILHNE